MSTVPAEVSERVAVVGMACRFPQAPDAGAFFRNIRTGRECLSFFSEDEVRAAGVGPELLARPDYVRAGAVLDGIDLFDAGFFEISPRQAELTDPQQRLFLECAWEALESAGCDPGAYRGSIGVYAGCLLSNYLFTNVYPALGYAGTIGNLQTLIGNDKDYLASHVSYRLNLRGPSLSVQSACSTSLVAIHLATQALLNGEIDMALAGAVAVRVPQKTGYPYVEGAIFSPDGHCRPFDAQARGTIFGNGLGIVVLKRLSDALREGDRIEAVVLGSAVNNDGSLKVGYTAPSEDGQAEVISEALSIAGVDARSIGYIEAHGTGTPIGDPIEIAALKRAFGGRTKDHAFCALGSVKANIGHLESAAGIAGFIKTVLALKHHELPPAANFESLNPSIDLAQSPFYVDAKARDWPSNGTPRRAGVSSFGIGGTNAHVVLEEAPAVATAVGEAHGPCLLALSARSPAALRALAAAYPVYLGDPDRGAGLALRDICYTAGARRRHHAHRLAVVAKSHEDLSRGLAALRDADFAPVPREPGRSHAGRAAFVFSGQGSQWPGMGGQLLRDEPVFREAVEECDRRLRDDLGARWSLLAALAADADPSKLQDTEIAQPAIFAVQVGLARLWRSWGIEPAAVCGHSVGEAAAAHVAGTLTLGEALAVVFHRGRLMQRATGRGSMAAVSLGAQEVEAFLTERGMERRLCVAAVNAPRSTVLSGEDAALDEALSVLRERGVHGRPLRVAYAFHSPQMEPFQAELARALQGLAPRDGSLPFFSTVTGRLCPGADLGAAYWRRNVREPVLFSQALAALLESGCGVVVEVGPHPVLLPSVDEQLAGRQQAVVAVASLRRDADERMALLGSAGRLYSAGLSLDWRALLGGRGRCVELPLYPWQRQRYWLEAKGPGTAALLSPAGPAAAQARPESAADWLHTIAWRQVAAAPTGVDEGGRGRWLILADRGGLGERLAASLAERGQRCELAAASGVDWTQVLQGRDPALRGVVHLGALDTVDPKATTAPSLVSDRERACAGLLGLSRLPAPALPPLWVITRGAVRVGSERAPTAVAQTPVWGLARSLALQRPDLRAALVDLDPDLAAADAGAALARIDLGRLEGQVALRGDACLVPRLCPLFDEGSGDAARLPQLKPDRTYLVTGGLGGLGRIVTAWLVDRGAHRIALLGRSAPTDEARRFIEEVESRGAEILVHRADVTDAGQLARALEAVSSPSSPLAGVIHAAGALEPPDSPGDWSAFASVLAPKMEGAWNLHALTRQEPLEFFILFSSIASVLGSPRQASYAAANAFLDGLAHLRRGEGLPATSIAWGVWAGVGMSARPEVAELLGAHGLQAILPARGLSALGAVLNTGAAQVVAVPADWATLAAQFPRAPEILDEVAAAARARGGAVPTLEEPSLLLRQIEGAPPDERTAVLSLFIRDLAVRVLKLDGVEALDVRRPLQELGLDSLMAIEFRNALSAALGQPLPVTLLFNYPSVEELAGHLAEVLGLQSGAREPGQPSGGPSVPAGDLEGLLAEEISAVETLLSGGH